MLLEFSCSNHKSIRGEVKFSALAGTDTTYEDKLISFGDNKVLRASAIYGANGSGKSNFIDAISFMQNLVTSSINNQPGQGLYQKPHKLESYDTESRYSITFVAQGVLYAYGFSLRNMLVYEEYLYHFPKGRQAKVFERSMDSYEEGASFRGKLSACRDVLKDNKLLLSCAASYSSVVAIKNAFRFFTDELVVYDSSNQDDWLKYSLYQISENSDMKESVVKFMQELGMGVRDIYVEIHKKKIDASELPPFLSDEFKNILIQKSVDAMTAKVIYNKFSTNLMTEESVGVKKLFSMVCPLLDIIAKGKTLVCDEIESSLHEVLVYELLRHFSSIDNNNAAQMIFTTHDTGLLNLDIFRRDQIWFTELRPEDRSTDLYSLAELKKVRKDDRFSRCYISGRYGAIPMMNLDLASFIGSL